MPAVEIGAPDEALIRTVMLKHFTDRQLDIDPKVLTYLALHVDRSLAAAAAAVAAVDRAALASGRKISRQLVIEALRRRPERMKRAPERSGLATAVTQVIQFLG